MQKIIFLLIMAWFPSVLIASGSTHLEKINLDPTDQASLQKGAKLFVNYCLNCHNAAFMRYSRMAKDLGLSEEEVTKNLMFASTKISDTMTVAMPSAESKKWFGTTPPDLSVITRARGADWVYTYLKSFYLDANRPFGVNNLIFKDVGMPHVLWELQGYAKEEQGTLKIVTSGSQSPEQYEATVKDLVNFMAYMGEPSILERLHLRPWVMLFVALFALLAYLLKKEYWKDIQ